jgi:hypothetical protein
MDTVTKQVKKVEPLVPDFSKEAHERTIIVLLQDKESGEIIGEKVITKGYLAKAFRAYERKVVGSHNGKFILQV